MRVPKVISNGEQRRLEHTPRTLSYHVITVRVCGASRRSLVDRWHMITIMLKERYQRAAGGAAAAGPSATNEAGERAPGASRSCGRWRDAQERRLVQRATPETTFASDLTSCCLESW